MIPRIKMSKKGCATNVAVCDPCLVELRIMGHHNLNAIHLNI